MSPTKEFFDQLYHHFNSRNIEWVIAQMTGNVRWANGMEGGYVQGKDAVRDYWTRQFTLISSNVLPQQVSVVNEIATVEVRQTVFDLKGNQLADDVVLHEFRMKDGKIEEFNILQKGKLNFGDNGQRKTKH